MQSPLADESGSEAVAFHASTGLEAARRALAHSFGAAGLPGRDLDARLLVCAACACTHLDLIRDPDRPIGNPAAERLTAFAARRLAREPVSRIIGLREFWGMPFSLDAAVLDPRPETEGLVAAALDAVGGRSHRPITILELGVGSGAVLCALLSELPGAFGVGVDISAGACSRARFNARQLGLSDRMNIVCGRWADALGTRFDLIVSNPPYVAKPAIAGLDPEVRAFDPGLALDGGPDGLSCYREIARRLPSLLAPGGAAAFECGMDQGAPLTAILAHAGLHDLRCLKDLAGLDRVVIGSA